MSRFLALNLCQRSFISMVLFPFGVPIAKRSRDETTGPVGPKLKRSRDETTGPVGDKVAAEEGLVRRQVAEEVVRKADQLQCGIRTHTSLDRRQLQSFVWSLADRLQRIIKPALSAVRAHVWDCCRKILDTFCDFEPFCVGLLPGCLHKIALQRRYRFATVEVAIALQRIYRFAIGSDERSASTSLSDALRQRQDSERRLFLEVAAIRAGGTVEPRGSVGLYISQSSGAVAEARLTARLCGVYAAFDERCRHSTFEVTAEAMPPSEEPEIEIHSPPSNLAFGKT